MRHRQPVKPKMRFSKKVIIGVTVGLSVYTVAHLIVFAMKGSEPSVLAALVFGYAINQIWSLAFVTRAKIKAGTDEPKEGEIK